MKIKKFMAMMIAAVAMCVSFASCGDDDDDDDNKKDEKKVISAAESLAGDYTGVMTLTVMGSASDDTLTYEIKKIDDTHVSLTTPAYGSGAMALPAITLNDIPVSVSSVDGVDIISASVSEVAGSIVVSEQEKAYKFSDVVIKGTGKKVSIAYSLQYGKMPMAMVVSFTGDK